MYILLAKIFCGLSDLTNLLSLNICIRFTSVVVFKNHISCLDFTTILYGQQALVYEQRDKRPLSYFLLFVVCSAPLNLSRI